MARKTLYVILTKKCQMRCPFCYMGYADIFTHDSTLHVKPEQVADTVKKYGYKTVIFHGGEPLLYPDVILNTMKLLDGQDVEYGIQTNMAFPTLTDKQKEVLCKLGGFGTSYSAERFQGQPEAWENFKRNIRYAENVGLPYDVLITLTEKQCELQSAAELKQVLDTHCFHAEHISVERVQYPPAYVKKNRQAVEKAYQSIDAYMCEMLRVFPLKSTDIFERLSMAVYGVCPYYPTNCHENVDTLDETGLHCGCPSYENVPRDTEKILRCTECEYMHYCGGDCECMDYACAFPRKTFQAVKEIVKRGESYDV